jgi:alkylation response protein AidB-like acyl-CoA dehydrogenase
MFASGSRHAAWIGGHCNVHAADGTPVLDADGRPLERTMLFPKASAAMVDVWQVIGLRGTGTDNYSVTDLFVPEARSFTRESPADRREAGPLYRFTTFHLFGIGFAGVALGLGRATLDAFIRLAAEKTPKTRTQMLRDNAVIQAEVARSEAALSSAREYLLRVLADLWAAASGGDSLARNELARLRLAATYAIHQAKDVVDACYQAAGATAVFASNPFERRFRDMHTVTQQVQAQAANFELVGQVLLGLAPNSKLL